jgi:hypothetical protein
VVLAVTILVGLFKFEDHTWGPVILVVGLISLIWSSCSLTFILDTHGKDTGHHNVEELARTWIKKSTDEQTAGSAGQ